MNIHQTDTVLSESQFRWGVVLLLALVCTIAYFNTFDGEWVWDDASSVLLHKHVQEPGQFFQLFREDQHVFGRGRGNFYRPLVSASFMLDYALSGGPRPGAYDTAKGPDVSTFIFHLTNMLLHLAAALLFFRLLCMLGAPRFVQWAAPLIFVVHPLHTEAVAYISGRADMMSAVAIFAALCFAAYSLQPDKALTGSIAAAACFIAGLLSKESTLIYPILLALLIPIMKVENAVAQGEENSRLPAWIPLAISFALLAAYLLLRTTVLRFAPGDTVHAAPLAQRLVETTQALGMYVKLLFVPTNLHMERVMDNVSMAYALLGLVVLIALVTAIGVSWHTGNRRIAAGFAWFLAAWLPISGLFPLNAPMAEHWMYVPMAGFWWALMECAHLALRRWGGHRLAYAVIAVLCLMFVAMTAQRNLDWRDNETLFRATLRQNPNSARVHFNLAVTYEDLLDNDAGARRHYEYYLDLQARKRAQPGATVALDDEIETRLALGRVLLRLQDYEEAAATLLPLVRLEEYEAWKPAAAFAAFQTGQAMLALGEVVQANGYFEQALRIEPQYMASIEQILSGQPIYDGY